MELGPVRFWLTEISKILSDTTHGMAMFLVGIFIIWPSKMFMVFFVDWKSKMATITRQYDHIMGKWKQFFSKNLRNQKFDWTHTIYE